MDRLLELQEAFNEPGDPIDFGCSLDRQDEIIMLCEELNQNKSICVVSNWTWWDIKSINVDNSDKEPITLVKADKILFDELDRFPVFGWVRTSPLVATHFKCVFETKNTFYILIGPGTRKNIAMDNASAFF